MDKERKDLTEVVSKYLDSHMYSLIRDTSKSVIKDRLRWMDFTINVEVNNKIESEKV